MRCAQIPLLFVLAMAAVLIACGKESPTYSLLPGQQTFHQDTTGTNNVLDVLFVINDQPNMSAFQEKLVTS